MGTGIFARERLPLPCDRLPDDLSACSYRVRPTREPHHRGCWLTITLSHLQPSRDQLAASLGPMHGYAFNRFQEIAPPN